MIEYQGRRYVISKKAITDTHGNTHGWFGRVHTEDGTWRVVRSRHRLERFPLPASEEDLTEIVEAITQGLANGTLIAEPRPASSAGDSSGL